MVELVIFKVPDGTKRVLKELAAKRGYMGLSDFLRDLVRRELQNERTERKELKEASKIGATPAKASEKASELEPPPS
jgi:metal-responsive CopG/Arc/MetJ family transcriptional regulator